MPHQPITQIVIIGGGTAGWMTAAALSRLLPESTSITLIESDQIGTVGVGEATLPHLRYFNQRLGIAEPEFMRETNATFKLGIKFVNWGAEGDAYIHPFGDFGRKINGIDFHHFWHKRRQCGCPHPIGDYSLPVVAAGERRFAYPSADPQSLQSTYSYAYHIDATAYARYLRGFSEARGVSRREGRVVAVQQHPDTGFIESVSLEDGGRVSGQLFVDCSGFRGLLIEQALQAGYEHWNHWLPCDRAVAIPSTHVDVELPPYTQAIATQAGWRWRIPLQQRMGTGHVYSSPFMDDQTAVDELMAKLGGEPMAEPNLLRFATGRRKRMWVKNCVAIGLSAGFLEPLESTGIHLIQLAIMKLIEFFPDQDLNPAYAQEFNRLMRMEIERIKDFLILHYHATERSDSEFWNHCRTMTLPDELQRRMDLFRATGQVVNYQEGLFLQPSWVAVYLGQRVLPTAHDPRLNPLPDEQLARMMDGIRDEVQNTATALPAHNASLDGLATAHLKEGWQRPSMSLYR